MRNIGRIGEHEMEGIKLPERVRGENKTTRQKEAKLIQVLATHLGYSGYQFPPRSGKYRIDGYLTKDDGTITGWVEAKWYDDGKHPYCAVNATKYLELQDLAREFSVPSYFVCRRQGGWGFSTINNGIWNKHSVSLRIGGGTPAHRPPNDDDIEPLVFMDKDGFQWFK